VRDRALFRDFFRRELKALSREASGPGVGVRASDRAAHRLSLRVHHRVSPGRFSNEALAFVAVRWPWLAAQEGIQRGATKASQGTPSLIRKSHSRTRLVIYASVSATLVLQLAGYLLCSSPRRLRRHCTGGAADRTSAWVVLGIA
jgi:hypothetical protein